jgi:predicted enzyme related to lactoylglutathione lyase
MKAQKLVWFDVPVKDMARAIAFYAGVVGWEAREEFPGVAAFVHDNSVTGGCLSLDAAVEPSKHGALLYYNVTGRHDEAEARVAGLGGEVLAPKHAIGPFGYRTLALDSEGNRIALHSEPEVA